MMIYSDDFTTTYAQQVVSGNFISCKWEVAACQRHLDDLKRDWEYIFDTERANYVFNFFEKRVRHVKGELAGKFIILDEWTKFYLGCVYGWVRKDTGVRRFSTAYIRVARGNYKSTIMSGLTLYHLGYDPYWIPGTSPKETAVYDQSPEVYCIAVDRGQANIVWGAARDMALASPEILKTIEVNKTKMENKKRGGCIEKLSRDTKNKDGAAPNALIIDEYHAHISSEVKDTASNGKGKRAQAIEWIITTAGDDALRKPCYREDETVKQILSGKIQADRYFAIIYELDEYDDLHDESLWKKASPALRNDNRYSETLFREIKTEHDLAFGSADGTKIRAWTIKRANKWVVAKSDGYFSEDILNMWDDLSVSDEEFYEMVKGREMFYGFDLSKKDDLTANAYVWRLDDEKYAIDAIGFIPKKTIEKHLKTDRVPYREWIQKGDIIATEEDIIQYPMIEQNLHDIEDKSESIASEIAYDPYKAFEYVNALKEHKNNYTIIEVRQLMKILSEPTKKLKELTISGDIIHRGNPVLRWCLVNCEEIIDTNDNIKVIKSDPRSPKRIDLVAATINALARAYVPVKKVRRWWDE